MQMKIGDYEFPDDLKYDKDYGWVKIKGEEATIGVNEFGVKRAKEIAFIELPPVGDKFKRGQEYAVLEAAKWSGHLKMPLSGEITEVNEKLMDGPALLTQAPYENWLVKIKIADKEEVKELMDIKEAEDFYQGKVYTCEI